MALMDEACAAERWRQIGPLIEAMMRRLGTEGEFPVEPGSALAGDDRASAPYQVSHVVRQCLMAGVDHLDAAKVLVVDVGVVHLAAPSSLSRGALENFATAYWILGPKQRNERIERTLRWHSMNARDADKALSGRGIPSPKSLEQRLQSFAAVGAARGLQPKRTNQRFTSSEAVRYCDNETNGTLVLGVMFPWQLCSGFAHGRQWAYLGMLEVERISEDAGVVGIRLTSDPGRALYPALAALNLLTHLIKLFELRAGASLAG